MMLMKDSFIFLEIAAVVEKTVDQYACDTGGGLDVGIDVGSETADYNNNEEHQKRQRHLQGLFQQPGSQGHKGETYDHAQG